MRKANRNSAENARAALFLCELTVLTGDPKYRAAAERAWKAFDEDFAKAGLEAADWALAMRVAAGLDDVDAPRWQAQKTAAPTRRVTSYRPR